MQELWKSILDLLSQIVIPDWGALIELIPIALLGLVLFFFALTIRAFASAGPTRRAPARVAPVTPAHLHMPGSSGAPILGAVGTGVLLWGVVVGGAALTVGLIVFVAGLLYWGREAIRDYDHATRVETLPAIVHSGPPPGVHMPGPSFRPILGAIGTAALLGGLVVGGWLLAAGLIIFVTTLVGWLVDARAEYAKTVEADRTGHLENIPAPAWPRRLLQFAAVLLVLAALLETGVLPPRGSDTAGGATGGGATGGGAAGSPNPSGAGGPSGTSFKITARNIAYDTTSLTVAANAAFTITFTNADAPGVTHDVDIRAEDKTTVVQDQEVTNGGAASTYSYTGLPAGAYVFICSIHPIDLMTGTLTVK